MSVCVCARLAAQYIRTEKGQNELALNLRNLRNHFCSLSGHTSMHECTHARTHGHNFRINEPNRKWCVYVCVCANQRESKEANTSDFMPVHANKCTLIIGVVRFHQMNSERKRHTHTCTRTHKRSTRLLVSWICKNTRSHPLNMKRIFINFRTVCTVFHALCTDFAPARVRTCSFTHLYMCF